MYLYPQEPWRVIYYLQVPLVEPDDKQYVILYSCRNLFFIKPYKTKEQVVPDYSVKYLLKLTAAIIQPSKICMAFLTITWSLYNTPINSTSGMIGELVGIRLFKKSNSLPIGEQLYWLNPHIIWLHCRKLMNSFTFWIKKIVQSNAPGQKFWDKVLQRGLERLNSDRCIIWVYIVHDIQSDITLTVLMLNTMCRYLE